MMHSQTQVTTGSRLHFGLMNLPPSDPWPEFLSETTIPARFFGGIGLMVERPCVEIRAKASNKWRFSGPLRDRAQSIAALMLDVAKVPHEVTTISAPDEHIGLGVGTQFSLAIGTALTHGHMNAIEIAKRVGRGARSSVGIHGFIHGGFIVDAGKCRADEIGIVENRLPFPSLWPVLLLTPRCTSPWFGPQETTAFAQLVGQRSNDESMSRLVHDAIVPAIRKADMTTFGPAITEYNIRAGELFRPVQSSSYSHPIISDLVDTLLQFGFAGAGQTSWGPTIFAFTDDHQRISHFLSTANLPSECSSIVTRSRNQPSATETTCVDAL